MFVYVARLNKLDPTPGQVETFMSGWQELSPFPECAAALDRLGGRYRLIAHSNSNPWFLDHLVKNRIKYDFDSVMSVEDVGSFTPAPGVYRRAARNLGMERERLSWFQPTRST
jgi:HAD superfamily hydrolase (TIGR01493 family)